MTVFLIEPLAFDRVCEASGGRPVEVAGKLIWPNGLTTDTELMCVFVTPSCPPAQVARAKLTHAEARLASLEAEFLKRQRAWMDQPEAAPYDAESQLKALAEKVRSHREQAAALREELGDTDHGKALAEHQRVQREIAEARAEQIAHKREQLAAITID